jgi:hypothetical protein
MITGAVASTSPQTVIISQRDLERIRNETLIKSDIHLEQERKGELEQKAIREKIAMDRKIKMRELESISLLKSKNTDPNDIRTMAANQAIKDLAAEKVNEIYVLVLLCYYYFLHFIFHVWRVLVSFPGLNPFYGG